VLNLTDRQKHPYIAGVDLRDSASERQFREELRAWLAEVLPSVAPPPAVDAWDERRRYDSAWQRKLYDAGYAGVHWPREYGGREASPTEQLVFLEELTRAGAPDVGMNFVGLLHAGPTIMTEGTPEQKARYLPAILRGEEVWCQGFSEPNAGSDLASLRTRAVRDGDHYVVSGQKMWSSYAHGADYCEMLVRTDPDAPKHKGITWVVMPMDSPGIDVRPLVNIFGSGEFAEMFLDEVRIPVANTVGAENDGWRVAMVTFSFERGTAFVHEMLVIMHIARQLIDVNDDDATGRELGRVAAHLDALWALTKRNVSQAARTGAPGIGGSVLKLHLSEVTQRVFDLGRRVLGRVALSRDDLDVGGDLRSGLVMTERLRHMSMTIAAGTSQVQRNIVAERILGLPKEPVWTSS
jgi:alkylation response protein AidB-like acyl-CoA dehydrogenase